MRTTISLTHRRGIGFLTDYFVSRTVRAGDNDAGYPTIRYGRDSSGHKVLIKTWADSGPMHTALRPFWREEIRSIRALSAKHNSDQLLARVSDAGDDDEGFHLVVLCGNRRPIADLLRRQDWKRLSNSNRVDLWKNFARLAGALQLLHDQGLTHRNLDAWAVLAHDPDHPDFQLTGFEWATRLTPNSAEPGSLTSDDIAGQLRLEWKAYARLVRDLLSQAGIVDLSKYEYEFLDKLDAAEDLNGNRVERDIQYLAKKLSPSDKGDSEEQRKATFSVSPTAYGVLLLQVLQSALAAATEFPVESAPAPVGIKSPVRNKYYVHLRSRRDSRRESLSRMLGRHGSLSEQLHEALIEDTIFITDTWFLIGDNDGDGRETEARPTDLHFVCCAPDRTYTFETTEPLPNFRKGLLVSTKGGRSDSQFRRQLNAWKAMIEHGHLLPTLTEPARAMRRAASDILIDQEFRELDQAKQDALRAILSSKPLFVTHGPPGVGKTRLVAELCRQLYRADAGTKMLFSAQSHAAVDNLLRSFAKLPIHECLTIRCRSRDSSRPPGEHDVQRHADRIVKVLLDSPWFDKLSYRAQETIRALAHREKDSMYAQVERFHRRPLEALILRAADRVLSTANSSSLEHLLNEGTRFDWTIVEEAAKAHGGELLSPLLLSERYVMIGDHHQLPPFNADELTTLLLAPDKVGEILSAVVELGLPQAKAGEVHRLAQRMWRDEESHGTFSQRACDSARRHLLLFDSLVRSTPSAANRESVGFTKMLSYQHRMHPAISRIVSHAFYSNQLLDSDECKRQFSRSPPIRSTDLARMPDTPIVWIDVPWIQNTIGSKQGEQHPGPHSPSEVQAVLATLRTLQPAGPNNDTPTLALLTPYRKQVAALAEAIDTADTLFRAHLRKFAKIGGTHVHTVDSFQGSEADVVIVSLVRNNARASLTGALGFLRDSRRMNVLLSRAQWRLIVVGSIDFLQHTVELHKASGEIGFLRRMLDGFESAFQSGAASKVSMSQLTSTEAPSQ